MPDNYGQAALGNVKTEVPMTRIQVQTEHVKSFTSMIENMIERNTRHAHQMGFFAVEPPGTQPSGGAIAPVVSNLDDAITELGRTIDRLVHSMSLFN